VGSPSASPHVSLLDVWYELGGGPLRGRNSHRLRGRAWWRNSTAPNISLDLERGYWYDHARALGGGSAALVEHVLGYAPRDVGRWFRDHFGSGHSANMVYRPARRESDRKLLAEADSIRVALIWHVEYHLQLVKAMLWGPCHERAALRCRRLTRQLERIRLWTPRSTVSILHRLARRRPEDVERLYSDAEEFEISLAQAITGMRHDT
jgi:hypothetical protein